MFDVKLVTIYSISDFPSFKIPEIKAPKENPVWYACEPFCDKGSHNL